MHLTYEPLVAEARMLGAVQHSNIIKLHAVAACDPYDQPGFFLIMDRLYDTLENRLIKWQHRQRLASFLFGVFDRKGSKKAILLEERLEAASGLSAALEYLHERGYVLSHLATVSVKRVIRELTCLYFECRILHRDLKPENIGFDFVSTCSFCDQTT